MKRSKLFLTGMAALLLSFGLMMTGCDSGGDSDDGDPINAAEYLEIKDGVTGVAGTTAATFTVTVNKPLEADKKATFTKVADAAVEYIGGTGGTTAALQAEAIKTALNDATGAKYTAAVGTTAGTDDHIITLTQKTPYGPVDAADKPVVAIETYTAPPASDQTATITATADDTALVVIATGGTLKTTLYVYLKTTGTPASEITITGTALTGADLTAAGAALGNGVTVTPKTDRVVITGLTAADTSGGTDTLVEGTDKVKVTLKADAQQSGATAVAAHTGVPVVVPPETADPPAYVVVATAGDVDDVTKIHYTSASKSLKYQTTGDGSATTKTLDEDFDAALIAVLSNLVNTDTVEFDANGNANAVVFTIAPTAAAKLQAVLDNVGGMTPGVTLGADTTIAADVAVPAGKTLTIAASKTLTVSAAKTLTLAAGATVTLPDTAILTLAKTALITLADNTSVINVGATANNKFAIKGDSTGASTLTAGGTGSETVSLSGIAAGSTILGSANSATLAITGNDAEIAVAAATNGLTIDAVTVDVSAKGKITIGNGGKVTLAASGGGIKTGGNSGSGGESNYATGSTTGIAGTVNGCSITGAANDNNNIDKNDTFVSSSSGTVAVTPAS